jgi:hypothetical protein
MKQGAKIRPVLRLAHIGVCAASLLGSLGCSGNPAAPRTAASPLPTAAAPAPASAPAGGAWTVLSTDSRANLLHAVSARASAGLLELHVDTNVGWRLDGANQGTDFWIFLDTDRDRSRGCRSNPWSEADLDLGADFMLAVGAHWGTAVYRCRDGWWSDPEPLARVETHPDQHWFEAAVPLDRIGNPAAVDLAVVTWVGVSAYPDQMPPAGHVTFTPAPR